MLALCLSGALAAPVSKSQHAVAAEERFLVTETLSAEPSDYASEYDPEMDLEAQKKQLKALRKENRIAAEKVAKVSGDGKTAASMLQRHPHWDEEDGEEELSPRMAERKADHERQVEAHKAEHERQMLAKKQQHKKRKVSCKLHVPRSRRSHHRNHAQLFGRRRRRRRRRLRRRRLRRRRLRRGRRSLMRGRHRRRIPASGFQTQRRAAESTAPKTRSGRRIGRRPRRRKRRRRRPLTMTPPHWRGSWLACPGVLPARPPGWRGARRSARR